MKRVVYTLLALTILSLPTSYALSQTAGSNNSASSGVTSIGSATTGSVSGADGSVIPADSLSGDVGGGMNNPDSLSTDDTSLSTPAPTFTTTDMDAATIRNIQQSLNNRGYTVGRVDGVWSTTTAEQLRRFEASQGLSSSSNTSLNAQTLQQLGIGLDAISPAAGNVNTTTSGQAGGTFQSRGYNN